MNEIESELISLESELSLPIRRLIGDLKPYEISSLVPSFAKANYKNKLLLDLLCRTMLLQLEANPSDVDIFTKFFVEKA